MGNKKLPWNQSLRSFKRQKRKEFKLARQEINNLRCGCAYLPKDAYEALNKAMNLIEKSYQICKPWWKKA